MPTTRSGRVRHLLNRKQARVVGRNPFTIQLLYEVGNYTQDIILGIDPGRTNIGVTAVKEDGTSLFSAELATRNKGSYSGYPICIYIWTESITGKLRLHYRL